MNPCNEKRKEELEQDVRKRRDELGDRALLQDTNDFGSEAKTKECKLKYSALITAILLFVWLFLRVGVHQTNESTQKSATQFDSDCHGFQRGNGGDFDWTSVSLVRSLLSI